MGKLTLEERFIIEKFLNEGLNIKTIAVNLHRDLSTIYREIKRNTVISGGDTQFSCEYCELVCNGCKRRCRKNKKIYTAKVANAIADNKKYRPSPMYDLEKLDVELHDLLVVKKQSIPQTVFNYRKDNIRFPGVTTLYRYIHTKKLKSIPLLNFKRIVSRKQAATSYVKRDPVDKDKINRRYDDFCQFKSKYVVNDEYVLMDTVVGKRNESCCFLTIMFVDCHFMIVKKLNYKTESCVSNALRDIYKKIGRNTFKKLFKCVLTDNGIEFSSPTRLETLNGKHRALNLFYTHSYSSCEKGLLEQNHTLIREVFNKGESLSLVNEEDCNILTCNINSIPRKCLNGQTPFELFESKYGSDVLKCLGYYEIDKHKVFRNKNMFK